MFRIQILALAVSVVSAASVSAATYKSGILQFETQVRQSMWGEGNATRYEGSEKLTVDIGGTAKIDLLTGEVKTERRQTVAWSAWKLCKDTVDILCGDEPERYTTVTTDTRNGAEVSATTTGEIGAEVGYLLDGGSVGAEVTFEAEADIPDAVKVGEAFSLNANSNWTEGELDSQTPTAEAYASTYVDVDLSTSATACVNVIGIGGCVSGSSKIIDTGIDKQSLVKIDPNRIEYLDGLVPGLELTTPLLNQSASMVVNLLPAPSAQVNFQEKDGQGNNSGPPKKVGSTIGIGVEVASAEIQAPIAKDAGSLSNGKVEINTEADFISLAADLDALVPILPVGGVSVSLGDFASLSIDAYDVDMGPSLSVFQDLVMDADLWVDFSFDKMVEVEGSKVTSWGGFWDSLPSFKIFETTTFDPIYSVVASLKNVTGLRLGFDLTAELFKVSASIGYKGFNLLNGTLGPLFKKTIPVTPDFKVASLFDKEFDLTGFNIVNGEPFTVFTQDDPNYPVPVPVPASLPMLLSGFGLLAYLRRRRAKSS